MAGELWQALDLFWLCYTRIPGFSGWGLQRTGYPRGGSALRQDHWTMSMFQIAETEFQIIQSENSEESRHARDLQVAHQNVVNASRKGK